ncbi:DHH family phosphoesterase [Methanococcus voltae]|uniref:Phosphoesterase DHHA1 n=1 Tax=Methanococcus voltae (strain ATCC BAA-1334 / A3) TaxID=456320 RepID=D7DTX8_METV3|nr:DHH family phosphoesterase [Methanococcus voltae]MCS3900388.1 RecJ-like exonuclease [Methanococcus voltae]
MDIPIKNKNDLENFNNTINLIKSKIDNYQGIIRLITHHDPDGLTSGAILINTLMRINKQFHITIIENLNDEKIEEFKKEATCKNDQLFIFSDMGSGQIDKIINAKLNAIILDHHPVKIKEYVINNEKNDKTNNNEKNISNKKDNSNNNNNSSNQILQLNPLLAGIDGSRELSGSGTCYFLARAYGFCDLAPIALIGAIGDMQHKPFMGLNKFILNEARQNRHIKIMRDLIFNCFNIEVNKSIYYSTQPYLNLSNGEIAEILNNAEINPNCKSLTITEKENLINELNKHFLNRLPLECKNSDIIQKINENKLKELIIDRILINTESAELGAFKNINMNDAYYLSEILNACGRKEETALGLSILLGDKKAIEKGKELFKEYKIEVINDLKSIELKEMENLRYFIGNKGKTGIIASLMVSDKPVLGFNEENEIYKVSSRGNRELVENGLNLSEAMGLAKKYGGDGGGHNVASGAAIKKTEMANFLNEVNDLIGNQLKKQN